jgi:mono/diheme cytochrome c family protein
MQHPPRVAIALSFVGFAVFPAFLSAADEKITFEKHVRPILKAHCFQCHGEGETVKGKLDLRLRRFAAAGGDSGPAIEPGNADDSLLVERVESGEMPPGEKQLSKDEISLLRRWITEGAVTARPEPETITDETDLTEEDRAYWAFQPIRRPALPAVQAADRIRTPIDAFLLSRLEREKLGFSPEADKITLLRRAKFDLLGLPPTVAEVERFLADDAPDAFERQIDRFLDAPQYGERWGRHWLDVAGYADSDGYSEKDLERKYAWKYRDYVIRAFNDDKPWIDFIVEQLAGDELLAPPYANLSPEQADKLIATGFLRMGPDGTGDGAVDQNLARNETIAETIKIVSTSLLGMTVGCAQCHNHRYDPITQADYYRMRAIFEPAFDTTSWRAPNARLVSLWSEETKQKAKEVDAELAKLAEERKTALERRASRVILRKRNGPMNRRNC